MGNIRVEEESLENKEFDLGRANFERLAKRCQEAIQNGKVRSVHLIYV